MTKLRVEAPSGDVTSLQRRAYAILKLAGNEAGELDDEVRLARAFRP